MDNNRRVLSLDLETYSDVDLGKCGVHRYVEGDFHILLLAYAFDDEDVQIVDMAKGEQHHQIGMERTVRAHLPVKVLWHPAFSGFLAVFDGVGSIFVITACIEECGTDPENR